MKRSARAAAAALLAALALQMIASCGKEPSGQATGTAEEPETTAQEAREVQTVKLFDENGAVSVVSDTDALQPAADRLAALLEKRYGVSVSDGAGCVFRFVRAGEKDDYRISVEGTSVTLTAGSSISARAAIDEFMRRYTFGTDKTLSVPEGDIISYDCYKNKIDNSKLLSYIPSDSVKLIDTNGKGRIMSPEWIDSLIIVELRPLTASTGGTLRNSYDLLDFYAEVGVNCVWLTPIYEYGPGGNGYGNTGVHRIGENLTGRSDQDAGWEEMKKFVDHAHEKGIYVLLDVITWGVMRGSELTQTHPDWFSGEAWGNDAFNWKNGELREWFTERCVENIMKTGADGFRCDCEPNYTGYNLFDDVKNRLAEQGKYVIIISEDGSDRKKTYDFEQDGVLWYAKKDRGGVYSDPTVWFVDGGLDIVESVKTGKGLGSAVMQNTKKAGSAKYYTNCITNHDYQKRIVLGNRLNIGYAAITAPFIPLWYMGDEFNCSWQPAVQYDLTVNYADAEKPANRRFLEDVKRMIAVRRTYKDIFEYWPDDHRNTNLCKVEVSEDTGLSAYARYAGDKAVLIIPNNNENISAFVTATVPFDECGIADHEKYRLTELWTGEVLGIFTKEEIGRINCYVPYENFAMILIEGL